MTDHAHRAAYLDGQADETDDPALAKALRTRAEREREQGRRTTKLRLLRWLEREAGRALRPSDSPGVQRLLDVADRHAAEQEAKARRDLGYERRERVERVDRGA